MKKAKKVIALVLCAVLLIAGSVMGTLAYLTSTAEVTNTFTAGNVTIELKEKEMVPETGKLAQNATLVASGIEDIKIVPGRTIEKQPVVIVEENSEKCWLFVKIENGDATKNILGNGAFACSTNWSKVPNQDGWYQYSAAVAAGNYQVFESFTFANLTSDQVAKLTGGAIKITAYAIQAEGVSQETAFTTAVAMTTP